MRITESTTYRAETRGEVLESRRYVAGLVRAARRHDPKSARADFGAAVAECQINGVENATLVWDVRQPRYGFSFTRVEEIRAR